MKIKFFYPIWSLYHLKSNGTFFLNLKMFYLDNPVNKNHMGLSQVIVDTNYFYQ